MIDVIQTQVEQLRAFVQADGADLEFVSFDFASGRVELRLVLEQGSCLDCILPREFLEQIALDKLQRSMAHVTSVGIDDPREDRSGTSA
jgi:Fe-S cluster biogenesis protein NfuA